MNTPHSMIQHPLVTSEDHERQDFTPQQIERLVDMARTYPWIEFVGSNQEWQRLLFLKWRYDTGRVGR